MNYNGHGAANEYVNGDTRGAHLKLAQRHHKITPGQFHGRKRIEHEFPHPGVVGQLAISFTPSSALPPESRIVCIFPDNGWAFPTSVINSIIRLPQGLVSPPIKATYTGTTRTLEFTLLSAGVPAKTPIVILVSGVKTPECATPTAEATVTSYERLVIRDTSPVSTRGGQVLDGPTAFTISRISPAELSGPRQWKPFICSPGRTSDVTLSFVSHGSIPLNGRVIVELPPDGWEMETSPTILLRTTEHHNVVLCGRWECVQHTLDISIGAHAIRAGTSISFTIKDVKNPSKETMNLADDDPSRIARVTTLLAAGSVIDGPTRIDVARISELRAEDYLVARKAFDAACAISQDFLPISEVPEVLKRAGIFLPPDLFEVVVVPAYPTRVKEQQGLESAFEPEFQPIKPTHNELSRQEFLNVFSQVYAPAYKVGQELRLACGRGELERVRELICRGCDPNAKDGSGWSALHYAADYGQVSSIDSIIEATTELRAHSGNTATCFTLDPNTRDVHGWTPLVCAAANGHSEVVLKLISLGGDTMITTKEGRTALHWAAIRGMLATMEVLLSAGVDKEHTDRSGWTALHCAVLHGSESCIQALIDSGANEAVTDRLLYSPAKYSEPSLGAVAV